MNAVIVRLTFRALLGSRRAAVLAGLPAVLVALAILVRALAGVDEEIASVLVVAFGFGTLTPLLGLIAGTGSIGPEIGDGSIIYLLAKPVRRSSIILSKLLAACAIAIAFSALPIYVAGVILTGEAGGLAIAAAAGATVAAIAYCALFQLLAVVTRNAVVIGLLYALVWETLLGQFIAGAQELSIVQWSLALTERVLGDRTSEYDIESAVSLGTGIMLLLLVTGVAVWMATRRLRRLRLTGEE